MAQLTNNGPISIVWFRRDLRFIDHTALTKAGQSGLPILPIFIFDTQIISELPKNDARICFIYKQLKALNEQIKIQRSSFRVIRDQVQAAWHNIIEQYNVKAVYFNRDYEPYAIRRDKEIEDFLIDNGIEVYTFKDQVIFEKNEVVKNDGLPYTVFSPYKRKWLSHFANITIQVNTNIEAFNWMSSILPIPSLEELGFQYSTIDIKPYDLSNVDSYGHNRDIPSIDGTSYLSPHLRFGTVSIRHIISLFSTDHQIFLSELIWREFFMQILYHYPHVVDSNFKPAYDQIDWRFDEQEFELWCLGQTGFPLVDAGMRQLNETGYMHNRVRMVVAGFLCKHLLIHWKHGEAYFAKKLLDYELSSNNGNWQWAAGTGCDAAPYFRIFNPMTQHNKFDKENIYVNRWVPEWQSNDYVKPIVDHKWARSRAINAFKTGLSR